MLLGPKWGGLFWVQNGEGIWGQNGLVKELVVGKSTSKHNNNNVSDGGEGDDDVPIFTSIKTTLQTRKMFPQQ